MINWSDWFMQLVGTLIGAGVGFSLALYGERITSKKKEVKDRDDTIRSILLEIDRTLLVLDIFEVNTVESETIPGAFQAEISIVYLVNFAFDAAVHSGKLTLLNPDLQDELSTCHEAIRIARIHYDKVITFYATEGGPAEHRSALENANNYLKNSFEMLKVLLPPARDNLIKAGSKKLTREYAQMRNNNTS
ncbi:MAG TPA: hypothetical protein VGW76_03845 [Pyrinomonadaceae bacterium]|nr:hypothetical protein [Pyrinomonadaceae bacterium]